MIWMISNRNFCKYIQGLSGIRGAASNLYITPAFGPWHMLTSNLVLCTNTVILFITHTHTQKIPPFSYSKMPHICVNYRTTHTIYPCILQLGYEKPTQLFLLLFHPTPVPSTVLIFNNSKNGSNAQQRKGYVRQRHPLLSKGSSVVQAYP